MYILLDGGRRGDDGKFHDSKAHDTKAHDTKALADGGL
jgi:hypothetical protein